MDIAKKYHIILCDDVRHEVGNKLSLMGVYGADLCISRLPAMLPHLCIVVMLEGIVKTFHDIQARVLLPDSQPLFLTIPGPPRVFEGSNHTIVVAFAPAKINSSGKGILELYFFNEDVPQIHYEFAIKETMPVVLH